jgi:hypothetical protein
LVKPTQDDNNNNNSRALTVYKLASENLLRALSPSREILSQG